MTTCRRRAPRRSASHELKDLEATRTASHFLARRAEWAAARQSAMLPRTVLPRKRLQEEMLPETTGGEHPRARLRRKTPAACSSKATPTSATTTTPLPVTTTNTRIGEGCAFEPPGLSLPPLDMEEGPKGSV